MSCRISKLVCEFPSVSVSAPSVSNDSILSSPPTDSYLDSAVSAQARHTVVIPAFLLSQGSQAPSIPPTGVPFLGCFLAQVMVLALSPFARGSRSQDLTSQNLRARQHHCIIIQSYRHTGPYSTQHTAHRTHRTGRNANGCSNMCLCVSYSYDWSFSISGLQLARQTAAAPLLQRLVPRRLQAKSQAGKCPPQPLQHLQNWSCSAAAPQSLRRSQTPRFGAAACMSSSLAFPQSP